MDYSDDPPDFPCRNCTAQGKHIAELEAALANSEARNAQSTCVWCGSIGAKDDIAEHVLSCINHPIGRLVRREEELYDALDETLDRLLAYSDEDGMDEDDVSLLADTIAKARAALNPPAKEKP